MKASTRCSLFITKVPQGVHRPRPMPNAMGRRPIADGARATRCTPDGHREPALHPKTEGPTPHTFAPPPLLRRSFTSDDTACGRRPPAVHSAPVPHLISDFKTVHTAALCGLQHAFFAALRASWRAAQQIIIVVHASRKKSTVSSHRSMIVRRFRSILSGPAVHILSTVRIDPVQVLRSSSSIEAVSLYSPRVLMVASHACSCGRWMLLPLSMKLGHSFIEAGVASQKVHFRVRHFAGVFASPQ